MDTESQHLDYKSLRVISCKNPKWSELAKDCVAFANAQGGRLRFGIEDGKSDPPAGQLVKAALIDKTRSRITELTVNVLFNVQLCQSKTSGGEFLEIEVFRSSSPASTTDGRFYLRVGDACKPLVGEEIQRLLSQRSLQTWETMTSLKLSRNEYDKTLLKDFVSKIRASARVKSTIKEKSDRELLDHYYFTIGAYLSNLGILCIGRREHRAQLGSSPIIHFIKYDDFGHKVNKLIWDDHSLSPMQLIDSVWSEVPDFRESYELPDGLFRQQIPVYDGRIIREFLVNALVHRPYYQHGDIYFNLFPDRLEIINPGLLPQGVTPQNILHKSVRRNNEMARVFHDLGLMEREGSGYDMIYDVLLSQGRPLPKLYEGDDYVKVVIEKRIIKPELIDFLLKADQTYQLRQRERIVLGLLAQNESMTSSELAKALELSKGDEITSWLGRLPTLGILQQTGRTKGTRYSVKPQILHRLEFTSQTNLVRIEPHRLDALVLEDLSRYPGSAIGDIHERIGSEVKRRQVKLALDRLCEKKVLRPEGEKRWRRYWIL